ncbi:MAG TPA: WbqC family protein [Cyclobacteriaceae bacterium]|nr:WbqC family protein [Cyclobacteriaceae bacterium]
MTVLIEPHYLPSLEYFCALLPFREIRLEGCEYFPKQTYRNRCYVNTAQGRKMLTVPLAGRSEKMLTRDVRVEGSRQWRNIHWRTIESAYRKAPFFDHYSPELKNILFEGHDYLLELNRDLLSFCLRSAGMGKSISVSMSYEKEIEEVIFNLRSLISDKKPFMARNFYRALPYYQVFGSEFVPNLSFIDLLLCEGPGSMALLKAALPEMNN